MDPSDKGKHSVSSTASGCRFTLWQLLLAVLLVSLLLGLFPWLSTDCFFALLAGGIMALGVWFRSRWVIVSSVPITGLAFLALLALCDWDHRPTKRTICRNRLKTLTLALQNYHDAYGSFPPAYVADRNGKPMHSWRVLILPFLDCGDLYARYRLDEPWNGPNNRKLARHIPDFYRCPADEANSSAFTTSYVAVVGPDTMWPGKDALGYQDIPDGKANTVILVESADCGIHWMEPRDLHVADVPLQINPTSAKGISGKHPGGAQAALVDGSVIFQAYSLPADTIRLLITRNDGQRIPPLD